MKIQPVKGTRDFFPPLMAVHNYILDGWKAASLRNGFEEYEGPIFEHLKMYEVKSGEEIVEQLFSFSDRGGRDLAIRPEITPTLARMVNQQINTLARPIKWFSMPRLCRAERPQKGRLREFWQWNIDIIGVDSVLADAEVIFTSLDYLRAQGLTSNDIKAKISSRKLLSAILTSLGIADDKLIEMYALLDKKAKLPADVFEKSLTEKLGDEKTEKTVAALMELDDTAGITSLVELNSEAHAALDEINLLFDTLKNMQVCEYCEFDMGIVRGLAYYTGPVFEVHDVAGELRAVCGGGRFDNLLKDFGGPSVPATGMGMGDCVLQILLEEKGLLKPDTLATRNLDYYVAVTDEKYIPSALEITSRLRTAGLAVELSYKTTALGKQLKQAAASGAKNTIIAGEELDNSQIAVKNMQTGSQTTDNLEEFLTAAVKKEL